MEFKPATPMQQPSKRFQKYSQGNEFAVQSTPTFFLNNVKIEGALPLNQLYMLMDEVLARAND